MLNNDNRLLGERYSKLYENVDTGRVADIIQWVVWAVANKPREFIMTVYGQTEFDGYTDEKIGKANNEFISWWGNLGTGLRKRAIETAIEMYDKGDL